MCGSPRLARSSFPELRCFAAALTSSAGNLPSKPGIYPDYLAPIDHGQHDETLVSSRHGWYQMNIGQGPEAETRQMQVDKGHASSKGGYRIGNLLLDAQVLGDQR